MNLRIALSLAASLGSLCGWRPSRTPRRRSATPSPETAVAAEAGQKLYDQACQACHGQAARGDRGPALSTGVFRHGGADGEIFTNIRAGIRGTQMPAFAQFRTEQIWQLVSYLRSLAGPSAGHEVRGRRSGRRAENFRRHRPMSDVPYRRGAGRAGRPRSLFGRPDARGEVANRHSESQHPAAWARYGSAGYPPP